MRLALLLGARADAGAVRPGAARLSVEGVVEVGRGGSKNVAPLLDELGLELEEGRLIIRREVSSDGRSRAWVNGSPTTISVLLQLGRVLVDMHGQHETQTLLHPEHQRGLLDAFADAEDDAAESGRGVGLVAGDCAGGGGATREAGRSGSTS
jgi:DNA repair protein RecN (Recombination protein N)